VTELESGFSGIGSENRLKPALAGTPTWDTASVVHEQLSAPAISGKNAGPYGSAAWQKKTAEKLELDLKAYECELFSILESGRASVYNN
jgi:hypothetical protein